MIPVAVCTELIIAVAGGIVAGFTGKKIFDDITKED
jgi:ABC-type dipeptide/oligopeptide/nickel transport system permease subunit